ncbi:MAG: hypothetical protein NUW37_02050 [Planctomycetes bacterium]|nr:hypothetical protein [Planctomycetota bacterium]
MTIITTRTTPDAVMGMMTVTTTSAMATGTGTTIMIAATHQDGATNATTTTEPTIATMTTTMIRTIPVGAKDQGIGIREQVATTVITETTETGTTGIADEVNIRTDIGAVIFQRNLCKAL